MIDSLDSLTLDNVLSVLYGGIAAAVAFGAVVGLVGLWLSSALKAGE